MNFATVITAIALAVSSTSAFAMGRYEPTEIWVHPKLRAAEVLSKPITDELVEKLAMSSRSKKGL